MDLPSSVILSTISRGDILHSEFEGVDHGKFFVIMGISNDSICGFFFINSNINRYIFQKTEFLALQYQLRHTEYSFLKHDSFVCASNVKRMPLATLSEGISKGEIEIIDRLREEHVKDILEMVRNSKVINKRDKLLFFQD